MYVQIYVHRERERERQKDRGCLYAHSSQTTSSNHNLLSAAVRIQNKKDTPRTFPLPGGIGTGAGGSLAHLATSAESARIWMVFLVLELTCFHQLSTTKSIISQLTDVGMCKEIGIHIHQGESSTTLTQFSSEVRAHHKDEYMEWEAGIIYFLSRIQKLN